MKNYELRQLGIPHGDPLKLAAKAVGSARLKGMDLAEIRIYLADLAKDPAKFLEHDQFGALAKAVAEKREAEEA